MTSELLGESTSMNGSIVEDDSATMDSIVSAVESDMASKFFRKDSANYDYSIAGPEAVFSGSELEERSEDSAHGSKRKGKRARCEIRIDSYQPPDFHVR